MTITNRIAAALLIAAAAVMVTPASAATSSHAMSVSATVMSKCSVSSNAANLAVSCSNDTPYTVVTSNGTNAATIQAATASYSIAGGSIVTLTYRDDRRSPRNIEQLRQPGTP